MTMTAQTPLLAIEDLHAAYGLSRVLFGVSLDVQAGECVCLLGRNGVGKTTTMRSVMGSYGRPPATHPVEGHQHCRLGTAPGSARRDRICPGGPAGLRRADGVGKPRCRDPRGTARRRVDNRFRLRTLPGAARTARPARRISLRRRATNADHRAQQWRRRTPAARRAVEGLAPLVVEALLRNIRALRSAASPFCWPNRASIFRWRWPIVSLRAGEGIDRIPARPPSCATMRHCAAVCCRCSGRVPQTKTPGLASRGFAFPRA